MISTTEKEQFQGDVLWQKRKRTRRILAFVITVAALAVMFFAAVNIGSLKVSFTQLWRGLFVQYDATVATIYDLRFPRIVFSMLAGAGIATAGALFQAVLKNPLADPGIIGISSGAAFFSILISTFLPALYFFTPVAAFLGGLAAFLLVYGLSWKGGLSPLRILLTGVAVSALFSGLASALNSMTGGDRTGTAAIVNGNISQKTWEDVSLLLPYILAGLVLAVLFAGECNLLSLEDKTAKGLGMHVDRTRMVLSLVAVLLASISTAVVGSISFLGLIVPHMGRVLVGSNHKVLIPFSALLGSLTFLIADTVGRTIAYPYEVSAAVVMSVLGGPVFVILLRRSRQ